MKSIYISVTCLAAAVAFIVAGMPSVQASQHEMPAGNILASQVKPALSARDSAIVAELSAVNTRLFDQRNLQYDGFMKLVDHENGNAEQTSYFSLKEWNGEMYFKMGDAEVISLKDIFISINHVTKRVFLSQPKPLELLLDLKKNFTIEDVAREHYKVSKSVSNGITSIALQNNQHETCKMYRVSFDTSGYLTQIYIRKSSSVHPMDIMKDQVIVIQFNHWYKRKTAPSELQLTRYLLKKDQEYSLSSSLSQYKLIGY